MNLDLLLPDGIDYVGSSATGAEFNVQNGDTLNFILPTLNQLSSTTVTFQLSASCMQNYTAKQNQVRVAYSGSNQIGGTVSNVINHLSNLYAIATPDLALVSMTNQTYSGNIGDVITRCITITNGGNGALVSFELSHEHGVGLAILNNDLGIMTSSLEGTLYTFGASDFATVGNGDGRLDPGESITICETLEIVSCSQAQSVYNYRWGCDGEYCQSLSDAANVVFAAETPNLTFTPWNSFTNNTTNGLGANCYGNNENGDFPSSLTITNTGTGNAVSTLVSVGGSYTSHTNLVQPDYYSSFNINSLTIEINGGGQQPITPVSTVNGYTKDCLPPSPKNGFTLEIPLIEPGDVVVIRWNHYTCCASSCENTNRRHLLHWRYQANYQNNCGTVYDVAPSNNLPNSNGSYYYRNHLSADVVPGTMSNNETATMTFMAVNSEFPLPRNSSDEFKYRVTLPDGCLNIDPNSLVVRNHLGVVNGTPYTTQINGNVVEFLFASIVMGNQWTMSFDVVLDCASCPTEGLKNISFETLYRPSGTCDCWQLMGCVNTAIDVLCPPLCEGANLISSTVRRINLGLPDNNNDGLPDSAPHDMSLVRTDRMMHGDTLEIANTSFIQNSNGANFHSVVNIQQMTNHGQRMTYARSRVKIYRVATGQYYESNWESINTNVTTAGSTRTWRNSFNIHTLASLGYPTGVNLQTGDSVFVYSYYVNTTNNNANYLGVVNTISSMYATSNVNHATAPDNTLIGCNSLNKEFTLIGWYYTSSGANTLITQDCDEVELTQNYYLSIGPCCSNYNGGNLFPYEYRHWSAPLDLYVEFPDNYEFVTASVSFNATTGTLLSNSNVVSNLPPTSVNGNIYQFSVYDLFGTPEEGKPFIFGDDGFSGTLRVRIRPTCNVSNLTRNTRYKWDYRPIVQINPTEFAPTNWVSTDPVTYNGPILSMQSNILMVNSQSGQETWDLYFQNTSFLSGAHNFWIATPTNPNISGDSLQNLTTGIWYYPTAEGIFALENIQPNTSVTYRLYTTMTSCEPASIPVYSGWGCSGIPSNIDEYECEPLILNLTINPLTPSFEAQVNVIDPTETELCDELDAEITVRNYQLGYGFDILTTLQLPYGLEYIPGSSSIAYLGNIIPIGDPSLIGGTNYQWDLSTLEALENGLVGIVDGQNNQFSIRFRVRPLCGFNSGQRVYARASGRSFCGSNHQSELNYSQPIYLNNMTASYSTDVRIGIDFITPCAPTNETIISVINNGPGQFGSADSVSFVLPQGLAYTPNSFQPLNNANIVQTEPSIVVSGGQTTLTWPLMQGVNALDSMRFRINLSTAPLELPCALTELRAFTNVLLSATCSIDQNACETGMITGESSKLIYIYKTELDPTGFEMNVHLNEDGTETLSGSFTLYNQGADLSSNYTIVYHIHQDANGNGQYDTMDPLIETRSASIFVAGGTAEVITFDNIPVSNFCGGSIRILLQDNACLCNDNSFVFNVNTTATTFDTLVCSNEDVVIGYPSISNNYTYSWSPANNLSDGAIPQPTFNQVNNDAIPTEYVYLRTVQKTGCFHVDTNKITVYPLPVANFITTELDFCRNSEQEIQLVAGGTVPSYSLNLLVDGVATQVTTSDTLTFSVPTDQVRTVNYQILDVTDASNATCTREISATLDAIIYPLPVLQAQGDTTICLLTDGINLQLTGLNATAEYEIDYFFDGNTFTLQTLNSQVMIPISTQVAGTFNYQILSIRESSAAACAIDTASFHSFTVLPLPVAALTSDTIVCEADPIVPIAFTGSESSGPYTFSYQINGTDFIGTGNPLFEVGQITTPGTYAYTLMRVMDASVGQCERMYDTTIIVQVNPLPIATLTGDTTVCNFADAPLLTFEAIVGEAPFIYTYVIAEDTVTITSSGNTVQLPFQTNEVGTHTIRLIGVEDASPTNCFQSLNQEVVVVVLPNPLALIEGDTTVCQNSGAPEVRFIGNNATPNYTFDYTIQGVNQVITSNGNMATITIPTDVIETYAIQLNRITDASIRNCWTDFDTTIFVTVNPLPIATISAVESVCQLDDYPLVNFEANNATGPYWIYYTLNGVTDSVTVTPQGWVPQPTETTGTYTYQLTGVRESSVAACANGLDQMIEILVRELPTAQIQQDSTVCQNDDPVLLTLTGAGTTSPYTFTYRLNGVESQVVAQGDQAQLTQSTAVPGDFIYELIEVRDASADACARVLNEIVTITINPLPTGQLASNATICLNTDPAPITFVGELGTPDYTFYYTIVETGEQLIAQTNGNLSVTIPSINDEVGVFTYWLTGVRDASVTQCYRELDQSITIEVVQLPEANLVGFPAVCEDDPTQYLTLSAINGGTPFTYHYTINGVPQTITSNGAEITLPHMTDNPGTTIYTLTEVIEGIYGCRSSYNLPVSVTVHPKPDPRFTFSPDSLMTSQSNAQFHNHTTGGVSYVWEFGDGDSSSLTNPQHLYNVEGLDYFEVTLTATSGFGCVESTALLVPVLREALLYVPNSFTPNGDGLNDIFRAILTEGYDVGSFEMLIFNRWGQVIFESRDPESGWDGTYKGDLVPDGIYTYTIQYRSYNSGKREKVVGHVSVLK